MSRARLAALLPPGSCRDRRGGQCVEWREALPKEVGQQALCRRCRRGPTDRTGFQAGTGGGAHRRLPLQQRGGRRNPPWPRGAACASHAHRGRLRPRHRHSHRRFRRRRRRRRRRRLALFPNATDHVIPLLRRGALLACAGAAVPTPPPSPARRGVARTVMRCGNVVWGGSVASHGEGARGGLAAAAKRNSIGLSVRAFCVWASH